VNGGAIRGCIEGVTQCFSVQSHHFSCRDSLDGACPSDETLVEVPGIEQGEDPGEGVVGRRPSSHFDKLSEPGKTSTGEIGHGDTVLGSTEDSADSGKEQIDQVMFACPMDTRVGDLREMFEEEFGIRAILHVAGFATGGQKDSRRSQNRHYQDKKQEWLT